MQELQKLLGKDAQTDLIFSPAFRMRSTAGLRLREICRSLDQASFGRSNAASPDGVSISSQEQELISLLLLAQSHNYTRLLNRNSQASDWQITTAEEFLRSNAHMPISLGDICQASGLNARTLQNCFRKKRGSSPLQFLRTIRMEEARKGLLNPDENTSVTSEAARWGFVHFGRFSQRYRQTFGELPSETLRRSRELCGGAPAALNKFSIAIR